MIKYYLKHVFIALLVILAVWILDIFFGFVSLPKTSDMVERQIDFITISTVFCGFSFTALSILLGISSEKLIEKIRETTIIIRRARRITLSLVYFILSVFTSMLYILGFNNSTNAAVKAVFNEANSILYILGLGFLILGIIQFSISVFELFDMVNRIYKYNQSISPEEIQTLKDKLQKSQAESKNIKFDDNDAVP